MFEYRDFNPLKCLPNHLYFLPVLLVFVIACNRSKKPEELTDLTQSSGFNVPKAQNVLSEKETKDGWKLLYDGKTANGWRGIYQETFPDKGWTFNDGALTSLESSHASERGGAIITVDQYEDFILSLEFRISKGANSGIKYFVEERLPKTPGHGLGLEYAILDDANYVYPERGNFRTMSSLYDLIPAKKVDAKPLEEWNQAIIIVQGNHVEHWLNGEKVVEFERFSENLNELVSRSKYKDIKNFAEASKGHILLQDEGTSTSFRNIKIKVLP